MTQQDTQTQLVINSIKDPNFFEFGDLLAQNSEKIPSFLATLLKFYVSGNNLDEFCNFLKQDANKKAVEDSLGPNASEILIKKFKIVLFCSFLDTEMLLNGIHEVPYAILKDKCGPLFLNGTEENDAQKYEKLEAFVFECLCAGVMNAKLVQKHLRLVIQFVVNHF